MIARAAGPFLAGVVLWPCLEYGLHRFLAHTLRFGSKFKTEHLNHHRERDYYAAGLDKLLAAVPAGLCLFAASLAATRDGLAAAAFTAGFFACYLFYEWTHKRFHTHAPATRLGAVLRKHHFIHHFVDSKSNHGVTTRLLDRLFGTIVRRGVVRIPKAFAPLWMLAPGAAEELLPAYREDYLIV